MHTHSNNALPLCVPELRFLFNFTYFFPLFHDYYLFSSGKKAMFFCYCSLYAFFVYVDVCVCRLSWWLFSLPFFLCHNIKLAIIFSFIVTSWYGFARCTRRRFPNVKENEKKSTNKISSGEQRQMSRRQTKLHICVYGKLMSVCVAKVDMKIGVDIYYSRLIYIRCCTTT